jgi:hypothetical protein
MEVVILRKGDNAWILVVRQGNKCPVLEFFKDELQEDEKPRSFSSTPRRAPSQDGGDEDRPCLSHNTERKLPSAGFCSFPTEPKKARLTQQATVSCSTLMRTLL